MQQGANNHYKRSPGHHLLSPFPASHEEKWRNSIVVDVYKQFVNLDEHEKGPGLDKLVRSELAVLWSLHNATKAAAVERDSAISAVNRACAQTVKKKCASGGRS